MSDAEAGRAWPTSALLAAAATGLLVGFAAGFGAGSLTAPDAPEAPPAVAAPTAPLPSALPSATPSPPPTTDAPPAANVATPTIEALPGSTLTLADLPFLVVPGAAPKDRVSVVDGVLSVSAIAGQPGVVAGCMKKRVPVADRLGVRLQWRRVDIPAGNPDAFGRVIVRAFGADGKVVKKGYLAVGRAPGSADWKGIGTVLQMPEGAVTAQFCAEVSGPAGRVEVQGLEISGVPAGSPPG